MDFIMSKSFSWKGKNLNNKSKTNINFILKSNEKIEKFIFDKTIQKIAKYNRKYIEI